MFSHWKRPVYTVENGCQPVVVSRLLGEGFGLRGVGLAVGVVLHSVMFPADVSSQGPHSEVDHSRPPLVIEPPAPKLSVAPEVKVVKKGPGRPKGRKNNKKDTGSSGGTPLTGTPTPSAIVDLS